MNVSGYLVIVERTADGGHGGWAPDLPGCVALGDSYEEAVAEMRAAIALHLEGLHEDGLPAPAVSAVGSAVIEGGAT